MEVALFLFIIFQFLRRPYDPRERRGLSKHQEEELLAEWEPEPLASDPSDSKDTKENPLVLESATGPLVTCNGRQMLNFASSDFLDLAGTKEVKRRCTETIDKYGVGSCGPRGFYGSIDVHLQLEEAIAKFYETEECILYSDGIACVASVIPTYARRGDLIVCDEAAYYGIQQGICLSRCNVLYFKHNDMQDLKRILDEVQEGDRKRTPTKLSRRFIVVEGIYQNAGDICPLDVVVEYTKSYKYRLILDDTLAFGVLGKTGKGTPEHFEISTKTEKKDAKNDPKKRNVNTIELICCNMESSLATVGGFCVGSHEVIDHQRLHGLGYCFSASAPPYTATAGLVNLGFLKEKVASKVRSNATFLRKSLANIPGIVVVGHETELNFLSPTIFLRINHSSALTPSSSSPFTDPDFKYDPSEIATLDNLRQKDENILKSVAEDLLDQNIIVYYPYYVPSEREPPWPSLRIFVTSAHTQDQLKQLVSQLSIVLSRRLSASPPSSPSSKKPSSSKKATTPAQETGKTSKRRSANEQKKQNT